MSDDEIGSDGGVGGGGGGRRSRRAKKSIVSYGAEQEFSDEDLNAILGEDSDGDVPVKSTGRSKSRSTTTRKSKGGGGAVVETYEQDENGTYRPSKTIYTEKGYDPNLLPIRERFTFLPEYEADGTPKIDCIVGRRRVDDKDDDDNQPDGHGDDKDDDDDERGDENDGGVDADDDMEDQEDGDSRRRPRRGRPPSKGKIKENDRNDTKGNGTKKKADEKNPPDVVEYEYLVKYKNRSYLHLDWKKGADLESMGKSVKMMYRRFINKVENGQDEELEDPEFDPLFVVPQKILAEEEQELELELTDKELLKWEKQKEKELALTDDSSKDDEDQRKDLKDAKGESESKDVKMVDGQSTVAEQKKTLDDADWAGDKIDFSKLTVERLKEIDGPYFHNYQNYENPYRDGYVTEPPKKPRASYLVFQGIMRPYFTKRNPNASLGELMTIIGDSWKSMSEVEQEPFLELARQEAKQYEKERALMEKAQRPNEMWQPMRRCMKVLDRICEEGYADIFRAPVDLDEFPDYEEIVETPMDLGTVRRRLEDKNWKTMYQMPEAFARDMRKIWNNCKIYNNHGSQIWHVADYMSKMFERLYHAWVLDFREKYVRWANPKARPWEETCRVHEGRCTAKPDEMLMCDHCDAMYGYRCLTPPLKKAPKDGQVWHCPECKPKLRTAKGARMLSAVAENAARKRADLGDTPKRKVKETMFLVKWAGLGYEYCTWETKADVGNPALIAEFRKLNNSAVDEPEMSASIVSKFLESTEHLNIDNAGGSKGIPDLRIQLYAQTRAFEFTKFGMSKLPPRVCCECGPATKSATRVITTHKDVLHPQEVVECVNDIVNRIAVELAFGAIPEKKKLSTSMPPLMAGEYDTVIPVTSKGLMLNVGEISGAVAFLGYRKFPDGSTGPAEKRKLIRGVGDKIIAVNGIRTVGKTFQEVIAMLKESGKGKFAIMRFLAQQYSDADPSMTSVGDGGRYAVEELEKKLSMDRKQILINRDRLLLEDDNMEDDDDEDEEESEADEESDNEEGSEGEFEPDSDVDDDGGKPHVDDWSDRDSEGMDESSDNGQKDEGEDKSEALKDIPSPKNITKADSDADDDSQSKPKDGTVHVNGEAKSENNDANAMVFSVRPEATHSLAYRLLGVDIGYSSDEGGDEDCAFFVDGVDDTFTSRQELQTSLIATADCTSSSDQLKVPIRRTEFANLGDRSKLVASVAVSAYPPDEEYFDDNFPFPSRKAIAEKAEQEAAAIAAAAQAEAQSSVLDSPDGKLARRSTTKVEQISAETGEVVNVWANVESAAATLQLPLNEIRRIIRQEFDEDFTDEVGGFRWQYALTGAKVTAGETKRKGISKQGREAWLEFRDRLYDPAEPHIYKNENRLRDYQVEGVNWLASTFYRKQGCILADEMGLGKTVQIVTYLEHLFRVEKIRGPFLVVVPLSTIEHWRREFEGWTEMVACVYHDRQRVWRDVLREYEWYYEDKPHTPEFLKFHVLVTTYDTLITDFDIISQIPFRVSVVDEAHRLRNQKGKLLECMREVSARGSMQHGFQSRVLMSGTPLQNDLNELWTLLNFIEPFKFPELETFLDRFGNMKSREQVENLQAEISPFMLRRVKEDVAKDIPAKEETVIDVELTAVQKQYYRAIFEHNHTFLNMGVNRLNAPKLMNIQMELRKACNHPCLLEGVEHREHDRIFKELLESGQFEGKTPEVQQQLINEQLFIQTSGKMVLMDKLLPKLRQEGHKILVFSQMVRMLDLMSEYLDFRNYPYERLDGRVRGSERQKSIDRFNSDPDAFLFLLSTRAGGVGINLTAADICIIFDSDWNPQNDVQAQARCHRIGQTKDVRIYRLVTSRSFEQEMFDRASKKLGLEQAVLGTFGQDEEDGKPTSAEMEQLLKKGAYALLDDDNDEITQQFCADDIDSILAKRTRTRVVEGAKTASWLNKQGMVVSKSKFTSDSKSAALDMDDPDFWSKVLPDFISPAIMMQKLEDLSDEVFGPSEKKKKTGRGRGRPRKVQEPEPTPDEADKATASENDQHESDDMQVSDGNATSGKVDSGELESTENADSQGENNGDENETSDDEAEEMGKEEKFQLTRGQQKKVTSFMADLKSLMENVLDDAEEDNLQAEDRAVAQKLLLTVSVQEKLFNEEHRRYARSMLKLLDGNRRRRCRTTDQQPGHINPAIKSGEGEIREELRIVSSKKKKKKRRKKQGEEDDQEDNENDDQPQSVRKRRKKEDPEIGDDGYKKWSDDEAEWSDVAEDDIYGSSKKKATISSKEANRRRQWAANDDAATAAGRPWPAFPRDTVWKVLSSMLDDVIAHDEARGGVFSTEVPRDEYPEYYEVIKQPMDYGTMKKKLENGNYRSAQGMRKDFDLIFQNCLKFNAADSDIVKEARQQVLMRPSQLRKAAMSNKLFLAEDGSVLYIEDDEKKVKSPTRKGRSRKMTDAEGEDQVPGDTGVDEVQTHENSVSSSPKKPKARIKIKLPNGTGRVAKKMAATGKKRKAVDKPDDEIENDEEAAPLPSSAKKRRRKSDAAEEKPKRKPKTPAKKKTKVSNLDYTDLDLLRTEREQYTSDLTFENARKLYTKDGPWQLHPELIDKFRDVALLTLKNVSKVDRYDVFAAPVSVDDVPDYYEEIKEPMDLSTMKKKLESSTYGHGNDAIVAFYKDFLLMMDNCRQYNNDDSDVTEEAARIFAQIPEQFGSAELAVLKKIGKR